MSMQLTLPPQLEERLKQEAARRGMTADACANQTLDQHLPPVIDERRAAAIAMLERWAREAENMSEQEAAENAGVLRAIDEDRLSDRKLFTDILKDAPK
jgi:hypothetical protein